MYSGLKRNTVTNYLVEKDHLIIEVTNAVQYQAGFDIFLNSGTIRRRKKIICKNVRRNIRASVVSDDYKFSRIFVIECSVKWNQSVP